MSAAADQIPADITRPLFVAAALVIAFAALVTGWAIFAPLTTTIHASGALVSSRPSFTIQHPAGGRIARVAVHAHQEVAAGDLLFEMDVAVERDMMRELSGQIDRYQVENTRIEAIQAAWPEPWQAMPTGALATRHWAEVQALKLRLDVLRSDRDALMEESLAGSLEAVYLQDRVATQTTVLDRYERLLSQGHAREGDVEEASDRLLQIKADLARLDASNVAQHLQVAQRQMEIDQIQQEFMAGLIEDLETNKARLSDLERTRLELQSVLDAAEIQAPSPGFVENLGFETAGMVVARGETMAVIARELDLPQIDLLLDINTADQISVGTRGRLTIPSLPQRETPPMFVTLTAISPEARKDPDGKPLGYPAAAVFDPGSLDAALATADRRFLLKADMPVSVALEGRKMTFASYLVKPFAQSFAAALQD